MRISDWSSRRVLFRSPAIEEFAVSHDVFPALSSQQRSLTRFLIEEQHAGHVNPELRLLIEVVARACKRISVAVGKGALGGVLGDAEGGDGGSNINVQGEAQKKLDVLSNDILLDANAWGGHLAGLASEAMDHSQPLPDAYPREIGRAPRRVRVCTYVL